MEINSYKENEEKHNMEVQYINMSKINKPMSEEGIDDFSEDINNYEEWLSNDGMSKEMVQAYKNL